MAIYYSIRVETDYGGIEDNTNYAFGNYLISFSSLDGYDNSKILLLHDNRMKKSLCDEENKYDRCIIKLYGY